MITPVASSLSAMLRLPGDREMDATSLRPRRRLSGRRALPPLVIACVRLKLPA